jgi:hypothetical protein
LTVLRVYSPDECDSDMNPLDWERCRECGGAGSFPEEDAGGNQWRETCTRCAGRGSLKAGALVAAVSGGWTDAMTDAEKVMVRCEGCQHLRSEGAWEGRPGTTYDEAIRKAEARLFAGREPDDWHDGQGPGPVHYSACDEGCRHGGPGRFKMSEHPDHEWLPADEIVATERGILLVRNGQPVEASWRQVDVRRLAYPNMLRPEDLAVLCLRCWAIRSRT